MVRKNLIILLNHGSIATTNAWDKHRLTPATYTYTNGLFIYWLLLITHRVNYI